MKVMGASIKDSNPKDAVGTAKVPVSTVPMQVVAELQTYMGRPVNELVVAEMGLALMEGALKYGRHNYRVVGVRASVYYDAAFRHRAAWNLGQDIDPDSGLSHVAKGIATLVVLRDSMLQGNWTDDRPPKGAAREVISDPLYRWWEGVDTDDDGFSLVTVALADLVEVRTQMLMGTWVDTRGARAPDENWVAAFNAAASLLLQKYPNPVPAFTEVSVQTRKT
jgi:hypothetical protein